MTIKLTLGKETMSLNTASLKKTTASNQTPLDLINMIQDAIGQGVVAKQSRFTEIMGELNQNHLEKKIDSLPEQFKNDTSIPNTVTKKLKEKKTPETKYSQKDSNVSQKNTKTQNDSDAPPQDIKNSPKSPTQNIPYSQIPDDLILTHPTTGQIIPSSHPELFENFSEENNFKLNSPPTIKNELEYDQLQGVLTFQSQDLHSAERIDPKSSENTLKKTPEMSQLLFQEDPQLKNWVQENKITVERVSAPLENTKSTDLVKNFTALEEKTLETAQTKIVDQNIPQPFSKQTNTAKPTQNLNNFISVENKGTEGTAIKTSVKNNAGTRVVLQAQQTTLQSPQVPGTQASQLQTTLQKTIPAELKESSSIQPKQGITLQKGPQNPSQLNAQKLSMQGKTTTFAEKIEALQQLRNQLKATLQKGETHLVVKLKPDDLGKVDIKIDISKTGTVSALFKTENREALNILTQHVDDIQKIFSESGLSSEQSGMTFTSSDQSDLPFSLGEQSTGKKMPAKLDQEEKISPLIQVAIDENKNRLNIMV